MDDQKTTYFRVYTECHQRPLPTRLPHLEKNLRDLQVSQWGGVSEI